MCVLKWMKIIDIYVSNFTRGKRKLYISCFFFKTISLFLQSICWNEYLTWFKSVFLFVYSLLSHFDNFRVLVIYTSFSALLKTANTQLWFIWTKQLSLLTTKLLSRIQSDQPFQNHYIRLLFPLFPVSLQYSAFKMICHQL